MSSAPIPDPWTAQYSVVQKIIGALRQVPIDKRRLFAREQLEKTAPHIVALFDRLPRQKLAQIVLYIALQPHSRENRLAAAAVKAGWWPILIHLGAANPAPKTPFLAHMSVSGAVELILATWLFPGSLVHGFFLAGEDALLFASLKPRRLVLDFYDTSSGMRFKNALAHAAEREAASAADGYSHRDLRMRLLQKHAGFRRFKHNVFICDPFDSGDLVRQRSERPRGDPIRIVSTGWAGNPPDMIVRIVRQLACERIHVHLHLNSFETRAAHTVAMYRQLEAESPSFHLEPTLSGEAYWKALAGYDFGLALTDVIMFDEEEQHYTRDYIAGCGSSRLSDYIRAGLGVICSPKLHFQNYWARRYAVDLIPATHAWLSNPIPALEDGLRKMATTPPRNLYSATVDGVATRLGKFYERVARTI